LDHALHPQPDLILVCLQSHEVEVQIDVLLDLSDGRRKKKKEKMATILEPNGLYDVIGALVV